VSENTLLEMQDSVDIRGLRKELLSNALKYYQRFVNDRSNDPALREHLANAYFRVGEITQTIESHERAIDSFRKAQAIWESLVKANPEKDELSGRLAQCHLAIGKQQRALGDLRAATASLRAARVILDELANRKPEQEIFQASLADCYLQIGIIEGTSRIRRQRTGDPRESEKDSAGADRPFPREHGVPEENGRDYQRAELCLLPKARLRQCEPVLRGSSTDLPVSAFRNWGRPQAGQAPRPDGACPVQQGGNSRGKQRV
jgi:tetratricopeptide (TPR) repeat protein